VRRVYAPCGGRATEIQFGWACRVPERVSALSALTGDALKLVGYCSGWMLRTFNSPLRAVGRTHLQYSTRHTIPLLPTRSLFNLFKKAPSKPESAPILAQDNLFHPFSVSPFPAIVARGEAIKSLAPCPVCVSHHDHTHDHTKAQPQAIAFECPDCGWPTHCTEEHWLADKDHAKYCSRLREVNEDEHDLRSGRRLREFELPGAFPLDLCVSELCRIHPFRKSRSTGYRSCHIFLQLGRILVYTQLPVDGYGTVTETR
jgi:hypothetical protein